MTATDAPSTSEETAAGGTWRDRAVERSLRNARAKAASRSDRFIRAASEIVSETGRTDFTVQTLIERSRSSLRSFYQHFSSKEELLLALFEEIIASSAAQWRAEIETLDDPLSGLHVLLERIHKESGATDGAGMNRALSVYHLELANNHPAEYARVLAPLRNLIFDLVQRGVADGSLRTDIRPETLAVITMQTLVGAAHMHALGAEPDGSPVDSERLWDFCLGGLTGPPRAPAGTPR
ncbi:MAG: TetR/AcrR family transcriptional regulator [Frankiaceae bacterium]|nr:TetR/AcrR family transcriptional regulator [Frankiaceae bacterium]MBV9872633.1 TetR/AcrR family transcriptional regulator [Frankiaceae bacterium]